MFVRTKLKDNGKTSVQIVESHRKADKVSQKIIRHVGQAVTEMEIEELKKLAQKIIVEMKNQRSPVLPIFSPEDIYGSRPCNEAIDDKVNIAGLREEQRIIEGIGDVFGKLYDDLGLKKALGDSRKDDSWNEILKACVIVLICFIAYTLVRQAMYRVSRQYEPMSFEKIRNELLHAQASILIDTSTGKKYILPSKTSHVQKKLYRIFGLKRSEVPRPMT
jgi:hypothetical protein